MDGIGIRRRVHMFAIRLDLKQGPVVMSFLGYLPAMSFTAKADVPALVAKLTIDNALQRIDSQI